MLVQVLPHGTQRDSRFGATRTREVELASHLVDGHWGETSATTGPTATVVLVPLRSGHDRGTLLPNEVQELTGVFLSTSLESAAICSVWNTEAATIRLYF